MDNNQSTQQQLIYICGDFNNAVCNSFRRQLGVKQLNSEATWKTYEKLLDPIFTNSPECYNCSNMDILGSDHATVVAISSQQLYRSLKQTTQKIIIRGGEFRETLSENPTNWNEIIKSNANGLQANHRHPRYVSTTKNNQTEERSTVDDSIHKTTHSHSPKTFETRR